MSWDLASRCTLAKLSPSRIAGSLLELCRTDLRMSGSLGVSYVLPGPSATNSHSHSYRFPGLPRIEQVLQRVYRPLGNGEGYWVLGAREGCRVVRNENRRWTLRDIPRSHQHTVYSRSVSLSEYPERQIPPAKIGSMRFRVDLSKTHVGCGKRRVFRC